jgi:hypothetical protein
MYIDVLKTYHNVDLSFKIIIKKKNLFFTCNINLFLKLDKWELTHLNANRNCDAMENI